MFVFASETPIDTILHSFSAVRLPIMKFVDLLHIDKGPKLNFENNMQIIFNVWALLLESNHYPHSMTK